MQTALAIRAFGPIIKRVAPWHSIASVEARCEARRVPGAIRAHAIVFAAPGS